MSSSDDNALLLSSLRSYADGMDKEKIYQHLLRILQTKNCQEVVTAEENNALLAQVFSCAYSRSHVDIVDCLVTSGMNVDLADADGWTPLMHSAMRGDGATLLALLNRNANIDAANKSGDNALILASWNGHAKTVELLLEKNASIDLQNNAGWTALMCACSRGSINIVQTLLNHNADVDVKNNGKTAIDLSLTEEIKEMLRNHLNTSYILK